jgi:hypothetical protein
MGGQASLDFKVRFPGAQINCSGKFFKRKGRFLMDYFKHYSTASESRSMNTMFDHFGHKGIAFYWLLVELCSENWDGVSEPEFNFHQRTVVTKLKSSLSSVVPWLKLSSDLGLCAFAHSGTQLIIKLPKLKDVKETRGRIKGNKSEKNGILRLDKDKEEEIDKEGNKPSNVSDLQSLRHSNHFSSQHETQLADERPSSLPVKPDSIIQLFNEKLAGKAGKIQFCRGLAANQIQDFITTTSYKEFQTIEVWAELFEKVSRAPFLTGSKKGSHWVVTLNWLVIHGNALKVLNGQYQEDPEQNNAQEFLNNVELN